MKWRAGMRVRHYKGGEYVLIGRAIHTETEEGLMLYMTEDGRKFARPIRMFDDVVDGKPRFEVIG